MKLYASATVCLLMCACAATPVSRQDQAIRDFISVEALQEEDSIRTTDRDKRKILNEDYLVYKGRKQDFLVHFQSGCYDLLTDTVVADRRFDTNLIRSRFDTINGCVIGHIYSLNEAQSAELIEIAEATEQGN
jgi:hypothetical protein